MKAYGIFDGGGVKGAALAGCLASAEAHKVKFVGFGGTSAGSIVATLGSVGYKGAEIRDLMKQDFHPSKLLADGGDALRKALAFVAEANGALSADRNIFGKVWEFYRLKKQFDAGHSVLSKYGLYDGDHFRNRLASLIKAKLPDLQHHADISFESLEKLGCPPLRIVASDLTYRCAAVFKRHDSVEATKKRRIYSSSVLDAVRASAGYPLLFQPSLQGGSTLVDGGLASNLPSFLFSADQEATQFPVLSFDLVTADAAVPTSNVREFFGAMFGTALEASDHLLLNLGSGVHHIQIPVPPHINTLNFDLGEREIDELFNAGYKAATEFLSSWEPLVYAQKAGEDLQQELRALHGDPKLFDPPLWALQAWIEENTKAQDVRTHIMLPTGREDNSRIVVYYCGFRPSDTDSALELAELGGCTGRALRERGPTFADLELAKKNFATWGLSQHQQTLVAADRKSMLSVPIFAWSERQESSMENLPILGILSVDSSTSLTDTGWVKSFPGETEIHPVDEVVEGTHLWADIIGKLLR
jgi:NTE family protein